MPAGAGDRPSIRPAARHRRRASSVAGGRIARQRPQRRSDSEWQVARRPAGPAAPPARAARRSSGVGGADSHPPCERTRRRRLRSSPKPRKIGDAGAHARSGRRAFGIRFRIGQRKRSKRGLLSRGGLREVGQGHPSVREAGLAFAAMRGARRCTTRLSTTKGAGSCVGSCLVRALPRVRPRPRARACEQPAAQRLKGLRSARSATSARASRRAARAAAARSA
jgi:hypothetical protein